eukprot:3585398-Amphidinium_carterae.1
MARVRALGLPVHIKARIVKSRKERPNFVPAPDVLLGRGLACVGLPPLLNSWLMEVGLGTLRQLKLDGPSQKEDREAALNAAPGGVWHEERAHAAFQVGDICVRCGEAVENLEHIVHHCPH